jgi:type I restriction enzyme M protein
MEQQQYSKLFSFLWNIANDVLVQVFDPSEYKKITLPFIVLRRLDLLLQDTKEKVLNMCKDKDFKLLPGDSQEQQLYFITGHPFYNRSQFTMSNLRAETDSTRLHQNFLAYLDGFNGNVQDIITKFDMRHFVERLSDLNPPRLGAMLAKVTDQQINLGLNPVFDDYGNEILPGLDNHTMGTLFEELIRKFNETYSVTDAGLHYTPRDYVAMLTELAILPVADRLNSGTYEIYDGACGTGGILSLAQERFLQIGEVKNKRYTVFLYGQELMPETFATCEADLMLSGSSTNFTYYFHGVDRSRFAFGSTISQDGHPGKKFDFCISNPPFGTPWKNDLDNWGISNKKDIRDSRFNSKELSFIPDIGDPQMLFLANNVSRMKDSEFGTRIVEIHNGSSLFTGKAGGGESNLRRHIIENDMLEAIIAMPEKMFYNTGIGTFIWIVTNRKEERRRGKVQLIDATGISTSLRKNLGEKSVEVSGSSDDGKQLSDRDKILKLFTDFEENEQSKIFDNREFGYWQITVQRPLREHVRIDKANLERAVKVCSIRDIEFSQEAVDCLAEMGIDASYRDTTPVANLADALSGQLADDVRTFKLPKTKGQLTADVILSEAMIVFSDMAKTQTLYLDYQEFEDKFNMHPRAKMVKLKFSNIEDLFCYFVEIDPNAKPRRKNGKIVPDLQLKDTEQVPLLYNGGIEGFMKNEVLPYAPDAYVDEDATVIGYELSFTKYFYKPVQLRSVEDIKADIREIEKNTDGLLDEILGGLE